MPCKDKIVAVVDWTYYESNFAKLFDIIAHENNILVHSNENC